MTASPSGWHRNPNPKKKKKKKKRELTLERQPDESGAVRARLLPQSLTALRLEAADPGAANLQPPRLIAMGRLQHLRAITIVGHVGCRLSYEDHEEECFGSILQSLEVQNNPSYAAALYANLQGCTERRCMHANLNCLHDLSVWAESHCVTLSFRMCMSPIACDMGGRRRLRR